MPKIRISSLTGTTGSSPSIFRLFNSAGITAAIGLAALPVFLTLSPMFGSLDVNAEVTETLGASATINSTLGLSADSISMVINPTSNGTVFKTGKTVATVSTNNETGYTLYLSDSDNNTALTHKNLADKAINSIDPTTPTITGTNMLPNTWGYTLGNSEVEQAEETNNETNLSLNYSPIPIERTVINKKETSISTDHTPITFGIKVNTDIPSGTYSDEVSITAVANYNSTAYPDDTLWLGKNGRPIETMQEMAGDICTSVPTPLASAGNENIPTIELTDTRDNKEYQVKKLADGNCWMTSDLALGSTTEDMTLTPEKSNVATDFTLHAAKTAVNQTADSYTTDYTYVGNNTNNNTYLYNWYAATAATSDVQDITSGNAPQDICPKGWHLPNSGAGAPSSWGGLFDSYKNITADDLASGDNLLGLHLTGRFYGGAIGYTNSGDYWSRTAQYYANAYHLGFNNGGLLYSAYGDDKQNGFAVRCVADVTTPAEATYMQEVTACPASLPKEKWYTLKDKRDNKEYTVARLADGNCWMTSDLKLENYTLTSADSNVTTSVTLPAAKTISSENTPNTYTEAKIGSNGGNDTYLYNWFAAVAAVTGANVQTDAIYAAGESAPQDICPKGWHLPNNDGNASWNKLLRVGQGVYEIATSSNGYSATKVSWGKFSGGIETANTNPLGLQATGNFNGGSLNGATTSGSYWTRTAYSADNAYYLSFRSGAVGPQSNVDKASGRAVRCVLGS